VVQTKPEQNHENLLQQKSLLLTTGFRHYIKWQQWLLQLLNWWLCGCGFNTATV